MEKLYWLPFIRSFFHAAYFVSFFFPSRLSSLSCYHHFPSILIILRNVNVSFERDLFKDNLWLDTKER